MDTWMNILPCLSQGYKLLFLMNDDTTEHDAFKSMTYETVRAIGEG